MSRRTGWTILIVANVLCYCVLSFYQASDAAPSTTKLPFANAVEQRFEMIGQLREIRTLLKEQNSLAREQLMLLRSANQKVAAGGPERR